MMALCVMAYVFNNFPFRYSRLAYEDKKSFFSLLKSSFSSLDKLVRTMQGLLHYICNSSDFAESCSWKKDVT